MSKEEIKENQGQPEVIDTEEVVKTQERTSVVENMNISTKKINPIVIVVIVIIIIVLGVFGYEIFMNRLWWGKNEGFFSQLTKDIKNISGKSGILTKMPKNFSQVAYMKFDTETVDLINATKSEDMTWDMKELLSSIKEFGAFEMEDPNGMNPVSFMIAKVDSNFDMNKAIKLGLVNTWADYIYKNLDSDTIIYWTKKWVEYFENYTWETIDKVEKLKTKLDDINDGKYNFAIFTKPDTSNMWGSVQQYLQNIEYGSMLVNLSRQRTYGELGVLFSGNLPFGQDYKFDPKLGNYLNDSSILFAEVGNLLPIFELNKEKLTQLLTSYAEANPAMWAMLLKTDYEKIANTLDWNMAISLTQAANSYGIWLAVIFEKWDIFDVVNKLFPLAKWAIQSEMWSWAKVNFIEQSNKIWFTTTIPAPMWEMESEVSLLKTSNNQAIVQILWPNINNWWSIKLNSNSKTVLNFFIDSGKIAELLKKYSAINPNLSIDEKTLEYYKNTRVYGQITLEQDKVLLTFDTQQ